MLPERYIVRCINREQTIDVANYANKYFGETKADYSWMAYWKYVHINDKDNSDEGLMIYNELSQSLKELPAYEYYEWWELINNKSDIIENFEFC